MFIELWERTRAYDKWPQVKATIQASTLSEIEIGQARENSFSTREPITESQSNCVLTWTDGNGNAHSAEYEVAEDSPPTSFMTGKRRRFA
jgi:hypothetical protein